MSEREREREIDWAEEMERETDRQIQADRHRERVSESDVEHIDTLPSKTSRNKRPRTYNA